jgi:hypothetical protein
MSHNLHDAQRYDSPASPSEARENDASTTSTEKPFLVELRQEHRKHTSLFVPAASLQITPALRTSGLLHGLEPDALKNLLYLLTFLSPEGRPQASLFHLAKAMQSSHSKVKARMQRLSQAQWQGDPVIIESQSENGYLVYCLHPRLIEYRHAPEIKPIPTPRSNSRERVIAHSRQHYARPRAEVERIVAQQLGQDVSETEEERRLRFRLESNGLNTEQARSLILSYDSEVIERQLEWLPYRQAKNPAGYLVAAVEGDYDEPRPLRARRAFQDREFKFEALETRSRETPLADEQWPDRQRQVVDDEKDVLVPHAASPLTDKLLTTDQSTTDKSITEKPINEELPYGETSCEEPSEEFSLEEALDKADALGPEDRWVNLTPDE